MNTKKTYTQEEVIAMMAGKAPAPAVNTWDDGIAQLDNLLTKTFGNEFMDKATHAFQLAKESGISTGTDAKGKQYKIGAKAFGDVFATRAYKLASVTSEQEAVLTVQPTPSGNVVTESKAKAITRKPAKQSDDNDVLNAIMQQLAIISADNARIKAEFNIKDDVKVLKASAEL